MEYTPMEKEVLSIMKRTDFKNTIKNRMSLVSHQN